MARDEKIIRADRLTQTLQVPSQPGSGFRRCVVERKFDNGGNEALDFLSLSCWVLCFRDTTEQFIDSHHRDGDFGGREGA